MADKMYEVLYIRKDGEHRTITMMAESKAQALEIAEARLAKQFPEGEDNPQSGYELDGATVKKVIR